MKGFTKKGKMFLQFETNLAESIQEQLTIKYITLVAQLVKSKSINLILQENAICSCTPSSCIVIVSCAPYRACTSQGATSWCVETTSTTITMTASRSITITMSASRSKTIIMNAGRFTINAMTAVGLQPLP